MKNIYTEIANWHRLPEGDPFISLHRYLGMPQEAYNVWAEGGMTNEELFEYGLYNA